MPSIKDLVLLSEVSKKLHRIVLPIIYAKVYIPVPEHHLDQVTISPMKTCFKGDGSRDTFNSLEFLKNVQLVAPFNDLRRNRCYRGEVPLLPVEYDDYLGDEEEFDMWEEEKNRRRPHDVMMTNLAKALKELLSHIPKNTLRGFSYALFHHSFNTRTVVLTIHSWNLGCCVPDQVFGEEGFLNFDQNAIQDLSLITDGTCPSPEWEHLEGLSDLRHLRRLSWKGLNPNRSQILLRHTLMANCAHLECLELEPIGCGEVYVHVEEIIGDTDVLRDVFHFNNLRHLSLTKVALAAPCARMATTFCIEQLQSLKLRDCHQTLEFLEGLTESSHIIKLRSFEVAIDEEAYLQTYYESNKPHPIESFLLSFQGLEELSISISNTFHPVNPITDPICHHRDTLRRLVYHEEGNEIHRESEGPLAWKLFTNRIVEGMNLECIGFCLSPSLLVRLAFPGHIILFVYSYTAFFSDTEAWKKHRGSNS